MAPQFPETGESIYPYECVLNMAIRFPLLVILAY